MPITPPASHGDKVSTAHTNRLINETSPYLLQHANNPVDWYAWGTEAFEAARAQDKPIFLSIGYSTCYWCHVMERESFEIQEVADVMNAHFISIKVDREERPDVDDIYMAAVQATTGSGGWPMSVFLEPQTLKPFLGGTYFPRKQFVTLLNRVSELWATRRSTLVQNADRLAESVIRYLEADTPPVAIGEQEVLKARLGLMRMYDRSDGGFGGGGGGARAMKFPMPVYLDLLMGIGWADEEVRAAVLHTLDRMATGGMYDHIGGGFHRYSTDARWLVPHFEKMLYDNGQLASTYAAAYERTGDAFYAEIVRETLDYVLSEMTGDEGAFYSAQDAEVNAREGGNYIWTKRQVREALTDAGLDEEIDFALEVYGFDRGTNFRDPHHPEDGYKNVVYLVARPDAQAREMGVSVEAFNDRLARVNAALFAVRARRDQPGTDDKVLAGWNGLMIGGMADGGRVLNEPKYIQAARRAAEFVLTRMRSEDGGLLRTYRAGQAKISGVLEDYALFIRGLIALSRATGDATLLGEAQRLAGEARQRFGDERHGAYFDTLQGQSDLFVRTKSSYDGAVPCGNTVMINNLLDLYELTGDEAYRKDAAAALEGISAAIARGPFNTALATLGLKRMIAGDPQILTTQPAPAVPSDMVTVQVSTEAVSLAPGRDAELQITLRIAEGYHVNAHEPGLAFLIPLDVRLIGSGGVAAHAKYPKSEPFRGAFADEEMRVYTGAVVVTVRLEQTGKIIGRPQLVLTYQVCTYKVCLAPKTEVLPVVIDG